MMVGVALFITKMGCNRWYMLLLAVVASALMDVSVWDLASVLNRKLLLVPELIMVCGFKVTIYISQGDSTKLVDLIDSTTIKQKLFQIISLFV